ncbi:beta-ketoacyl synthase N-terminal-like domain-containing protein [Streptomyces sp. NPDC088183]|uniref:beta-ketoacyl synthase N-terminal-like domain-containing protein n=1 Tax=Streptomyces sp. NPDC088183 TaxID=3160992 RepID=UPI0034391348
MDVWVTGLGTMTPLGGGMSSMWAAMRSGANGIGNLEDEWARESRVRIDGLLAVNPADSLARTEARRLDRAEQIALVVSREAWWDAGSPELPLSTSRWPGAPASAAPRSCWPGTTRSRSRGRGGAHLTPCPC